MADNLESPASLEEVMAERGSVGAVTILETYGPILDEGVRQAIVALFAAPPTLEHLLDARAKLQVFYMLNERLESLATSSVTPLDVMRDLTNYPFGGTNG